tara:strand:- start:760 stop:1008 length:249 start_codon:yes stop_codon:yes gene_type:complete
MTKIGISGRNNPRQASAWSRCQTTVTWWDDAVGGGLRANAGRIEHTITACGLVKTGATPTSRLGTWPAKSDTTDRVREDDED